MNNYMVDFQLLRVEQWFKKHKTHKGKWTLIERICKDLDIKTFPHQFAGRGKSYGWNNEIAEILNKLSKKGFITAEVSGRAYMYKIKEVKEDE